MEKEAFSQTQDFQNRDVLKEVQEYQKRETKKLREWIKNNMTPEEIKEMLEAFKEHAE